MTDATFAMEVAREIARSLSAGSSERNSTQAVTPGPSDNVLFLSSPRGEACTIVILAGRIGEPT